MSASGLRYLWRTWRREQLWFPFALLALFVLLCLMLPDPAVQFTLARVYLGFVVPLVGGVAAAWSVLDDPALELRFATPVTVAATLLSRCGLVFGVQAACALAFQLFAAALSIDLAALGDVAAIQLAWLVPSLAMLALGTTGALVGAQPAVGAFLAGGCWLVQLTMRGWFEANLPLLFLFRGVFTPASADLAANRAALLAGSAALLALGWALLHRRERYL